jgi:hypothetical protein
VLTAVTPRSGRRGEVLTLSGRGFTDVGGVRFGPRWARWTSLGADRLRVVVPAGTGTVTVRVVTPGGVSAGRRADRFRYRAPVVVAETAAFARLARDRLS